MKKLLSLLLVVLLMSSVVGCGGTKEDVTTEEPKQETETEAKTETKAEEKKEVVVENPESPLADPRVRKAMAYAIDMDALCQSLLEGKAIPANSLTPNGSWKVDGLNDYSYDPEKARALLKEANWDSSYEIDVVHYYGDQLTVDLMTAVQAYLADVGMKMSFRLLEGDLGALLWTPPGDAVAGPSAVDWDLAYAGAAALAMHEYYNRYQTGFASNSHTPSDPKLDKLIEATNATADVAQQKKAFNELQKYENDTLFSLPLYYQQIFVYESDRVDRKGIPYGNEQFAYDWRIIDWDVTPDSNGENTLYSNTGPVEFFEATFINPGLYMYQKLLFDRLIIANENLTPEKGQLASDYSVSDDGKVISFTLRDGLTWHDGQPLTVEDVQFTVEYSAQVPVLNAVASATYSSLEGYQDYIDGKADHISGIVIDGSTITFNFEKLDPNALLTFSQWPPLPKHLLMDSDPLQAQQASYWQTPVGSGPYTLEEVNMNDFVTMVPFKGYWDQGAGNIEKIQLSPGGDNAANVVINAEAGLVDYAYSKNVADAKAIEGLSNMKLQPVDIRYTRLFYVNKFPKAK